MQVLVCAVLTAWDMRHHQPRVALRDKKVKNVPLKRGVKMMSEKLRKVMFYYFVCYFYFLVG